MCIAKGPNLTHFHPAIAAQHVFVLQATDHCLHCTTFSLPGFTSLYNEIQKCYKNVEGTCSNVLYEKKSLPEKLVVLSKLVMLNHKTDGA